MRTRDFAAGCDALRRFRTQQVASGAKAPEAIERPFTFRLGRDEIRGRIDRVDESDAGTIITDYKSSDVRDQKRADTKARDSLQLQVYALAHEAQTGRMPAEGPASLRRIRESSAVPSPRARDWTRLARNC